MTAATFLASASPATRQSFRDFVKDAQLVIGAPNGSPVFEPASPHCDVAEVVWCRSAKLRATASSGPPDLLSFFPRGWLVLLRLACGSGSYGRALSDDGAHCIYAVPAQDVVGVGAFQLVASRRRTFMSSLLRPAASACALRRPSSSSSTKMVTQSGAASATLVMSIGMKGALPAAQAPDRSLDSR